MKKKLNKKWEFRLLLLSFTLSILTITANAEVSHLIPVGQTVGVTLDMKGVTVVDTTDIEDMSGNRIAPAKDSGISAGDVILEINDDEIDSVKELEEKICNNSDDEIKIKILRENNKKELNVKPVLSGVDEKYRIGVWVKDAASGIGTVTYFNPENNEFGALGHGIAEIAEEDVLQIKTGEILEANVVSVKKGGKGQPGELLAVFTEDKNILGKITSNTEVGVKGKLDNETELHFTTDAVEIARRDDVKEGDAEIICNVEEGKIERYNVEIQKINKDKNNHKGMVIKVKDERLLKKTGGIVQGMSGSPIIQNGKFVGAVTHVFINDPTRGYGIFIENMLKATE